MGLAWGLAAAIVCALAYGAATVLQAMGAARTKDTAGAGVDLASLVAHNLRLHAELYAPDPPA